MDKVSVYAQAEEEIRRFMWIESEQAGRDLGEEPIRQWVRCHWHGYLRARWLEHLKGVRFWVELDRGDFGLLQKRFRDQPLLLDRIVDRLLAGKDNLDIIVWAVEWGIPLPPVLEILESLDINSRRLASRFDLPELPPVTIDPDWLVWQESLIPRIARRIAVEDAYDGLPILADALEEAGCTDSLILEHCRDCHHLIRWSWVVELILKQSKHLLPAEMRDLGEVLKSLKP